MFASYKTFSLSFADSIGHLVLDQPPSNRMTVEFFSEFGRFMDEIREMKDLKALVISGSGRHFSAGADLDQLLSLVRNETQPDSRGQLVELTSFLDRNHNTFLALESLNIPVISAIRGVCLGSAFELALFTHFRFCGEDAVFSLPETSYNLIPGIAGTSKVSKICGKARTMELVLRGNTFSAEDALGYGLVDHIFPKKQVVEQSIRFAKKITSSYRKEKAGLYLKNLI
jgi:enoyl-CoA hydratase/carnithine racemase